MPRWYRKTVNGKQTEVDVHYAARDVTPTQPYSSQFTLTLFN